MRLFVIIFLLNPWTCHILGQDTLWFPVEYSNDMTKDAGKQLNSIIQKIEKPTVISFESASYYFYTQIHLKSSIVISGETNAKTRFVFDLKGKGDMITILGELNNHEDNIQQSIKSGEFEVQVGASHLYKKGMMVRLYKTKPIPKVSNWAKHCIGQMMEIAQVTDSSISFTRSVKLDYELFEKPIIQIVNPIRDVELSNLIIERKDVTAYQTSNVNIGYARNCTINNVVSVMTNFAHLNIDYSLNIKVERFDTFSSFSHGNGGKGYGIALQYSSTDCLIQNCVFRKMRHGVVIQSGANGNVIRGNYALEGFWEDVKLPKHAAGDIVLHGNYPYENLIEGNVCNQIVVDKSHGLNGMNTISKNRLLKYGIFIQSKSAEKTVLSQNDIVKAKFFQGKIYGKKKNVELNSNRRNNKRYKSKFDNTLICKPIKDGLISFYTIGYPCDFKNYYHIAFFRFDSSLISTLN